MASEVRFRATPRQISPENLGNGVPDNEKDKPNKKTKLPPTHWFLFVVILVTIYAFIHVRHNTFPQAKSISSAHPGEFVEERARSYLEHITNIGTRPAGSHANEVVVVKYILDEISKIQKSCKPIHKIEVDVQKTSGTFTLQFLSEFVSYYENMNNILVKFSPRNGAKDSLLVNCHYDTVVDSPGAGDDAVTCALMLEVLAVLAQEDNNLKHNVLFIFNGAEENILQASHGFITQHKWGREVRAFVNLDSAGAGGRELLFQAGPEHPWMLYTYAQAVPHPFASVIGQEIFQSGIIPSDTDYRIFRDYGHIPGVDIAYISNGYVYHTPFDTPSRIQPGSIQRGGDNLLALVKSLASTPLLSDPGEYMHGSVVFLDVVGLFMFMYPARLGYIINCLAAACVFIAVGRKVVASFFKGGSNKPYVGPLLVAVGMHLMSWTLALVVVSVIGVMLTVLGHPLAWFTHKWLMFVLYGIPSAGVILGLHLWRKSRMEKSFTSGYDNEQLYFEAHHLIFSTILLAMTAGRINSAVLVLGWVLGPLIMRDRIGSALKCSFKDRPALTWFLHMLGIVGPSLITIYIFYGVFEMFVPVMGRCGTNGFPDIFIGLLVAVLTIMLMGYHVGLVYITHKCGVMLQMLWAVFFSFLLLTLFTPLGFPFRANPEAPTRQRQVIHHIERTMHNLEGSVVHHDHGLLLIPFDINGLELMKKHGAPHLEKAQRIHCDPNLPYCGLPYYLPLITMMSTPYYYPGPKLNVSPRASIRVVKREIAKDAKSQRITFALDGPHHIKVYVTPSNGTKVTDWSVGDYLPPPSKMPAGVTQECYWLYYAYGTKPEKPMEFWVDVKILPDWTPGSAVIQVGLGAHYLFGENQKSPALIEYLESLPDWSIPIGWSAAYESFMF